MLQRLIRLFPKTAATAAAKTKTKQKQRTNNKETSTATAETAATTTKDATSLQIMSAGLFVSGAVTVLGVTRMAELAAWAVPPPVIRGVQLGVGLKVAIKGIDMTLRTQVRSRMHAGCHATPAGRYNP